MTDYPPPLPDAAGEDIHPFTLDVPQAALDDLTARLAHIRWPDAETVEDDRQGVPIADMRALVEAWDQHDWRATEARINALPHFRTRIDGLGIHFIHIRSRHENALPLVMTHGWPGSVVEFLDVIGPLTDPVAHGGKAEDAFHLVLPSLPGDGLSDKPVETGWSIQRIARAWEALMARLGYDRYVAQGGDWGAMVTRMMGHQRVHGLAGLHLNLLLIAPPRDADWETPAAKRWKAIADDYRKWGSGYAIEQMTRPQTLGYSLADSPVGQAAWIYEKFREWSDEDVPMHRILDDISLYWLTNSGASSARLYWESFRDSASKYGTDLPVAATVFPGEISQPPRHWAEPVFPNIVYWNEAERGGHFAAMEQPEIFVAELRAAFAAMR